jgi:hypothetical protein
LRIKAKKVLVIRQEKTRAKKPIDVSGAKT